MITSVPDIFSEAVLDAAEEQIVKSMTELLGRAGLEYQGRYVEVNGSRIHYLEYGKGSPVLLLHGGGAGSALWFRQIEKLSKTHRVIVPDHPLFGRLIVHPNRWGQNSYFKTMEVMDSRFADAGAYMQYVYDVTLTEGHAEGMRKSIRLLTDYGGQKSIFTDDELFSIQVPMLAIWGEYDPLFPVEH